MVNYTFKAKFNGDEQYLESVSNAVDVTPIKGDITLSVSTQRIDPNVPFTMTITAVNQSGALVEDLDLSYAFRDGDSTITSGNATTNSSGKCNITATIGDLDEVLLDLSVAENAVYNSTSITKTFEVGAMKTNISISTVSSALIDENFTVSGYLNDKEGNPIPQETVTVTYGSQTKSVQTNQQGAYTTTISMSSSGSYILSAKYAGSNNYKASTSTTETISILKRNAIIEIINSTLYRGQTFYVRLKESNGNRLANKNVVFTVVGKDYTAKTDSNGIAGLQINLVDTSASMTVRFNGDAIYAAASAATTTLTIHPYAVVLRNATSFANYGEAVAPYKNWVEFGSSANGYVNICGSASSPIAAGGTYNTPRALKASNFGFNLHSDDVIKRIDVSWDDGGWGTTDSSSTSSSTSFNNVSNQVQIINHGGGSTGAKSDSKTPGKKTYTPHTVQFDNPGATVQGVNSSDISVILRWGRNNSGNLGRLKCRDISLKVYYTPHQTRPA